MTMTLEKLHMMTVHEVLTTVTVRMATTTTTIGNSHAGEGDVFPL